jgi:hypothetical protein
MPVKDIEPQGVDSQHTAFLLVLLVLLLARIYLSLIVYKTVDC